MSIYVDFAFICDDLYLFFQFVLILCRFT